MAANSSTTGHGASRKIAAPKMALRFKMTLRF
jgi:hypothetical protein